MIEIEIVETGDRAEADTPEAAILAARTMEAEASAALGRHPGFHVRFTVEGKFVRECSVKSIGQGG